MNIQITLSKYQDNNINVFMAPATDWQALLTQHDITMIFFTLENGVWP